MDREYTNLYQDIGVCAAISIELDVEGEPFSEDVAAEEDDIEMETAEIKRKYNEFARWYDVAECLPEWLGLRRLRSALMLEVRGAALEVAAGTGRNLKYLHGGIDLTAVDLSESMIRRARFKGEKKAVNLKCAVMDACRLAFPDHTFDCVLSTLSTCTFPDPVGALREMSRVCRPAGQILLLEHGRSRLPWLARWQDRRAESHAKTLGCHWNREPLELANAAGLDIVSAERRFLGIIHIIRARPGHPAGFSRWILRPPTLQ